MLASCPPESSAGGVDRSQSCPPAQEGEEGQPPLPGSLSVPPVWAPLVAQSVKHLHAIPETWLRSLGQEEPLEKEMATHSSISAWRISWTEEPDGVARGGHNRVTKPAQLIKAPPPPLLGCLMSAKLQRCPQGLERGALRPPEAGGKRWASPRGVQREQVSKITLIWAPVKLMLDFWPPEVAGEKRCLWFQTTVVFLL